MEKSNKVSIIVPVYNREAYLDSCLRSVLDQSYSNWECLIIDDGSSDNSVYIAYSYAHHDDRFKVYIQNNNGPSSARNCGIKKSTGEWILFLDSDDYLEEKALECRIIRSVDYFQNYSRKCVVYGPEKYLYDSLNKPSIIIKNKVKLNGRSIKLALLESNIFYINSLLVSRNDILGIGGFDETLYRNEDWDLWLRLALSGVPFECANSRSNNDAAVTRIHANGLSSNKLNMIGAELIMREKIKNIIPPEDGLSQKINEMRIYHRTIRVCLYYLLSGKSGEAKKKLIYVVFKKGVFWVIVSLIRNIISMTLKNEIEIFMNGAR